MHRRPEDNRPGDLLWAMVNQSQQAQLREAL
jgi:hypothetical protein